MAVLNYNSAVICGRLTADPEIKLTQNGLSVLNFTIAVNKPKTKDGMEQPANFINCIAWRQTAEFISKFFHKGESIFVIGEVQTRSYTKNDGQTAHVTEILVNNAQFVDGRANIQDKMENASQEEKTASPQTIKMEDINVNDDLPF